MYLSTDCWPGFLALDQNGRWGGGGTRVVGEGGAKKCKKCFVLRGLVYVPLFNRFAHSAGPGVEGSVWQASSLRTPGQANGGSSYPMRVTRVARPARCFDGGFKTRSPGAAKISLPGLQNGLLEVSAEIVAGRLCGPPSEAAREFPGGHFGSYFCNARSKHAKR